MGSIHYNFNTHCFDVACNFSMQISHCVWRPNSNMFCTLFMTKKGYFTPQKKRTEMNCAGLFWYELETRLNFFKTTLGFFFLAEKTRIGLSASFRFSLFRFSAVDFLIFFHKKFPYLLQLYFSHHFISRFPKLPPLQCEIVGSKRH